MSKRSGAFVSLLFVVLIVFLYSGCGTSTAENSTPPGSSGVIQVVAAENFYGDIVKQLGGSHVSVTSILSDPNVDPHSYESNVRNGIAASNAQLVIENGGGYDDWMDKLLSASPNTHRIVLKAFDIAPHKLPENEHVWYGIDNIQAIAQSVTNELTKLDKADSALFSSNQQKFAQSIQVLQQKINGIKAKYEGTPVGLTETIFLYQSEPMGLKMLTPFAFQKAIAEGNDPPADTVATVTNQVNQKQLKVLIYNQQTSTPITTQLQNEALSKHIPVVPVTETMPSGKNYQAWMAGQMDILAQALQASTGK